jgi:hypothetical protein
VSTQQEAIIEAFIELGGVRTVKEIEFWVTKKYGSRWKDYGTRMADMVPEKKGGNSSSNIPLKFRVLKRVSRGKYAFIKARILPVQKSTVAKYTLKASNNHEAESMSNLTMPRYLVLNKSESVEVWSTQRLPFEPKDWLYDMRKEIRQAIMKIRFGPNKILYGSYVSQNKDDFDVENILFYNVGTGYFRNLDKAGVRFERVVSKPKEPPSSFSEFPLLHYHYYGPVSRESGFNHWTLDKPLVHWKARLPQNSLTTPRLAVIWLSIKNGSIESLNKTKEVPEKFVLKMRLRAPKSFRPSLSNLLKPLIDGAVASFHAHNGIQNKQIIDRLSRNLGVPKTEVSFNLYDDTYAVLGQRRLLWSWGQSVQWNPADDCCVAGEIMWDTSPDKTIEYSGTMFKTKTTSNTPASH